MEYAIRAFISGFVFPYPAGKAHSMPAKPTTYAFGVSTHTSLDIYV